MVNRSKCKTTIWYYSSPSRETKSRWTGIFLSLFSIRLPGKIDASWNECIWKKEKPFLSHRHFWNYVHDIPGFSYPLDGCIGKICSCQFCQILILGNIWHISVLNQSYYACKCPPIQIRMIKSWSSLTQWTMFWSQQLLLAMWRLWTRTW